MAFFGYRKASNYRSGKIAIAECSGFSLIDLLVTVSIVAILFVLAFPLLQNVNRSAKSAQCAANLRVLYNALETYALEKGSFPPWQYRNNATGATGPWYWYNFLWNSDPTNNNTAWDNAGILPNPNLVYNFGSPYKTTPYACPLNPSRAGYWRDPNYAYNVAFGIEFVNQAPASDAYHKVRMSNLSQPSKSVMLVDGGDNGANGYYSANAPSRKAYYYVNYYWDGYIDFIHHPGGKANFLMADGHIESLTKDETMQRTLNKTLLWCPNNNPGTLYWDQN